jgi:hypothetical protein
MKILTVAVLSFFLASMASAGQVGNHTANAISTFTFSGVKSEIAKSGQMSSSQRNCISNLSNTSLAAAYAPLLRKRFTGEKLSRYDAFFVSPLGKRYVSAFSASPSTAGFGAGSFSKDEEKIIKVTMNDPDFMRFASDTNIMVPGVAKDEALRLLGSCR